MPSPVKRSQKSMKKASGRFWSKVEEADWEMPTSNLLPTRRQDMRSPENLQPKEKTSLVSKYWLMYDCYAFTTLAHPPFSLLSPPHNQKLLIIPLLLSLHSLV